MFRSFDRPCESYDAVVAGASLGGVIAAAALTARGYKTALVDALADAGGRVGGTATFSGYSFPFGHRDAVNGIGDVAYRGLVTRSRAQSRSDAIRVHNLPAESVGDLSMADIIAQAGADGSDSQEMYRRLARVFGSGTADEDVAAREVQRLYELLRGHTEEEAWRLVSVRMGDWLTRTSSNLEARTVIVNQLEASHASPGEEASLGRFILSMLGVHSAAQEFPPLVGEVDVEGVSPFQAEIRRWLATFEATGGESFLGWKPVRITVERGATAGFGSGRLARVTGAVALNDANIVREFRAPIVITDHFGWQLKDLVDERLLPQSFVDAAEATKAFSGDVISWVAGTAGLPTIRATGETESFPNWQRINYGTGAITSYHGGFIWLTQNDPNWAPPGRHLLFAAIAHQGRFGDWEEAKAAIEISRNYISRYYADLDEVTEFSAYHWCQEPQILTWHLKPVYRHPVKVSTIEGLYVGSSSAEGMAGWIQMEPYAALRAVELADAEIGRSLGKRQGPGIEVPPPTSTATGDGSLLAVRDGALDS
jgi:phytoene dehydrogenase-like protein